MANLVNPALSPLLGSIGGIPGLLSLEDRVKRQLLTFPGEVVVMDPDLVLLKLKLCQHGYRVYSQRMEFSHAVVYDPSQLPLYASQGPDVILPYATFGFDPRDAIFVTQQPRGTVFYLAYNQVQQGELSERLVMVLISPDVAPVQGTPVAEVF